MIKVINLFIFLHCFAFLTAQENAPINTEARRPRTKEHYSAPGHYEIVAMINDAEINKGDSANVDIYITGYGQISQPKMFISSSSIDIFDKSYLIHGLVKRNDSVFFGDQRYPLDSLPVIVGMTAGITFDYPNPINKNKIDTSISYGMFIDANQSARSSIVFTELALQNPPYVIHLKFKDNATAGNYKLNLYFTYYNGVEWTGSITSIDFRINNCLQKHEIPLGILAVAAALVGILPGIQLLPKVYQKVKGFFAPKKRIAKPKK